MRTDTFAGTLLFGLAAALTLPCTLVLAHELGFPGSGLTFHLAAGAVLYCAGLARGLRRRTAYALASGVAMAAAALLAASPRELVLGAALVVLAGRLLSAPPRSLRPLLASLGCFGLALGFAAGLAGPSAIDGALAIWGFFLGLCLTAFFAEAPSQEGRGRDAFEEARASLARLLEDTL